jgi:aryl-alcohol dehydrogenase-like predicted oxidoreductase
MSWLLRFAIVASVIAGATSVEQVHANASSPNWALKPSDLETIDEILAGA